MLGLALVAAVVVPVHFQGAQYDSPGPDGRSPASLNAEWITIVNDGTAPLSVADWTVRDASRVGYTFGKVTIPAKGVIRLHTGKGRNTATDLYWNSGNYIWNNTGDTATLRDAAGRVVDTCTWKQKANRTWVAC
ncbi:lamin tail domain-containing protein [Actinoplanes sp. NPDC051861]|uniref:lamin tail domain-containing protein n=1 Tax=Actinoplanes sp. NPDC051861 TaxID=3155170 RepID=UPI0034368C6F